MRRVAIAALVLLVACRRDLPDATPRAAERGAPTATSVAVTSAISFADTSTVTSAVTAPDVRSGTVGDEQAEFLDYLFGNAAGGQPHPHVNERPRACPLVRDDAVSSIFGTDQTDDAPVDPTADLVIDRVSLGYGEGSNTGFWSCGFRSRLDPAASDVALTAIWSPVSRSLQISVLGVEDDAQRVALEAAVAAGLDPYGSPQAGDACGWVGLEALELAGAAPLVATSAETSEMDRWSCAWDSDEVHLEVVFERFDPGLRSVQAELIHLAADHVVDQSTSREGAFVAAGRWVGATPLRQYGWATIRLDRTDGTDPDPDGFVALATAIIHAVDAANPLVPW